LDYGEADGQEWPGIVGQALRHIRVIGSVTVPGAIFRV
jgi:hypothetical protein